MKDNARGLDLIFGALADPTRRRILEILESHGESTAGDLGERFPAISRPAVSKHLRILRESGLVEETKRGRHVIYSLGDAEFSEPADAWLEPFRAVWRGKLRDLKLFVETGASPASPETAPPNKDQAND